jgi:hypothetical protein
MRVLKTELNQVVVDAGQLPALLRVPENVPFVEERPAVGFSDIAGFHAVVNQRHTIEREHERGRGERPIETVAGDGAGSS